MKAKTIKYKAKPVKNIVIQIKYLHTNSHSVLFILSIRVVFRIF